MSATRNEGADAVGSRHACRLRRDILAGSRDGNWGEAEAVFAKQANQRPIRKPNSVVEGLPQQNHLKARDQAGAVPGRRFLSLPRVNS